MARRGNVVDEKEKSHKFSRQEYLEELTESLSDSFHKRIIKAYAGENPVESMESELTKILTEVLNRES